MARPSIDARLPHIDSQRAQVLAHPLARGLDTAEVARHLAGLPAQRFPSTVYGSRGPLPLIQPRGGVPTFDEQLMLTRALSDAGADFIPLTIDSCTRHNQYDTAMQLLRRSEEEGRSLLNGYPLVCHGHELTRQLYEGLDKPVSLRHGTPDARLLVELAIASGIVEIEGGGLCYCLPYSEGFPLDRALLHWQYVDRVCALYSTPGRPVHRESFGPLSATLVPPVIAITVQIAEALLAAEQGVMSFAVSFGQTGSFVQDVATARVLRALAREALDEHGFADVQLRLVYHQWMGQFPMQRERAAALIAGSAVVAGAIDADKIVVKTVDEAFGVPRPEVNAQAVDAVRYVLRTFALPGGTASPQIDAEAALIESEVRSLLQAIYGLSGDMFWESVYRAFQMGWIDLPFSPHADNANKLVTMRDAQQSIRIADPGALPLPPQAIAAERRAIDARPDNGEKTYRRMLADISMMV
ncbi:MAG: methylaspartate mutase subunit E [Aquincola tertiaricarbonis]|uniref:methylaspartate mutase subunit E n=1 Tax=Aquincola sp. J276 TaxID=2898432 RepID=UPI002151A320|nr:methylaspartate mutase subunit E [Aquincola sp. J276]MCR5867179.1 methylaspartate mutase subunit E [Aquincola sp. J276]